MKNLIYHSRDKSELGVNYFIVVFLGLQKFFIKIRINIFRFIFKGSLKVHIHWYFNFLNSIYSFTYQNNIYLLIEISFYVLNFWPVLKIRVALFVISKIRSLNILIHMSFNSQNNTPLFNFQIHMHLNFKMIIFEKMNF